MPTTRSQADTTPSTPTETGADAGDGSRAGAAPGQPPRREKFFIHPEILRGGAGYRRVAVASSEDEPGT